MKKKNIFFVLLICFINSSCNKEEQTDELQDKDFYSDVTTRASYISGTITGEMNPYVSDGYYTYDLSIPIRKNAGTTERDGRNDAKRLCTNVVTVSDEVKPKKRKMQGKAEYSRRTVCKSLPKKM